MKKNSISRAMTKPLGVNLSPIFLQELASCKTNFRQYLGKNNENRDDLHYEIADSIDVDSYGIFQEVATHCGTEEISQLHTLNSRKTFFRLLLSRFLSTDICTFLYFQPNRKPYNKQKITNWLYDLGFTPQKIFHAGYLTRDDDYGEAILWTLTIRKDEAEYLWNYFGMSGSNNDLHYAQTGEWDYYRPYISGGISGWNDW